MRTLNQKTKHLISQRENYEFPSSSQLFLAHVVPRAGETLNWHHITICLFNVAIKTMKALRLFRTRCSKCLAGQLEYASESATKKTLDQGRENFFRVYLRKRYFIAEILFSGTLNANVTTPIESMLKDRKNSRSIESFQILHEKFLPDS